ncbi:aspartyl protease family protein At5g10770-like [Zingiber officinale]|uniref:Peptidase A1 domain-containing protein n=1 Tax=Zingiber officinale TaxID=94328 RepID=A0A8J5ENZ6_ZINOF|nr:aspartyl protease family protein At5g10770-like [Zingiber officinale]KAG6470775.1 hypothetical protein ZIOFF_071855 [Zingiber officinale]
MVVLTSHRLRLLIVVVVVVVVSVFAFADCLEVKQSLSVQELRWGRNSRPRRFASTPGKNTGAVELELRRQKIPGPKILIADEARVLSIQSRIRNVISEKEDDSSGAQVPLFSGIKFQTLNYVVTVAVAGKNATVIVDTGSDLTWVQCKPCTSCYAQRDPLFDPSASTSYQNIPCNSSACLSLQEATGNAGVCGAHRCNYFVDYGDGSYSRGLLALERIDVGGAIIENFVFGCGFKNRGLFGGTAGIMGLGRTPLSLVHQTTAQFGGVFSYCLPTRLLSSYGSLVLGDDPAAYKNSTPISYTRMLRDPQLTPFYFLNLTGMTVGGVPLQEAGFSTGKILIDSGTVITRLPPSVYRAFKAEFVKQFSGHPPAPSFSILDTCFDLSALEEVAVPRVRMEFEGGGEMTVDVTGIFYFVKKDASQVCLAVASLQYEGQIGIIGNYQQKNQRVVYDTLSSRIGFAEEACGQ